MFFDDELQCAKRVRSDFFVAWLSDWSGVNVADPLWRYIVRELKTAALSPSSSINHISDEAKFSPMT